MQGLLNRDALTVEAIDVRPALITDRAAIHRLTENTTACISTSIGGRSITGCMRNVRPMPSGWRIFKTNSIGVLVAPFDESSVDLAAFDRDCQRLFGRSDFYGAAQARPIVLADPRG